MRNILNEKLCDVFEIRHQNYRYPQFITIPPHKIELVFFFFQMMNDFREVPFLIEI
jgi:hypothetical protein